MTLALQDRALVDRLIVLDMAPVSYQNEFDKIIYAMEQLPLREIDSRKQADELLEENIPDASLRPFLLQNLVQEEGNYFWRINLQSIRKSLLEISGFPAPVTIESYQGPVLFLYGSNSDYVQPHHHPIIKKYFAKSLLHSVDRAGHWLHIDQPEKVLEKITTFLGNNDPDKPPSLLYR